MASCKKCAALEREVAALKERNIDPEEQKSQIEQEMVENEGTPAKAKQKAASIALWEQKLTTFEELYNGSHTRGTERPVKTAYQPPDLYP